MFGKFFASTFTGSMMAAGPEIFSVWGYVIAHAIDSRVELNPRLLAAVIGSTPEKMVTAIEFLCTPDPESRSKDCDGCRLIREGEFQYFIPNHAKYRSIRDESDRREYNRIKKREERSRKSNVKPSVNDSQRLSTMSAQAEAEAEADTEAESKKDNNVAKRAVEQRGTRLQDDWQPSEEDRAFAVDLGLDPETEIPAFKDYWTALPGAKGRKLNWSKTWRNRCRELGKRSKPNGHSKSRSDERDREFKLALERGNAEYERMQKLIGSKP